MKKLSGVLLLTILSWSAFSQHICGTDLWVKEQIKKDPSFESVVQKNWEVSDQMPTQRISRNGRALDIIPVVVHVIHDNGIGNISYEQVEDAIRVLNEDFRRINSDTLATSTIFKPYAADSEIEFRLAKLDPNGNCTNGVVRVNSPNDTYDAGNAVKSVSYWPSNQYMNIWIINSIANFSGNNGTILGYAQFPGSGSWSTYGIVMRHDQFGSIGTSNADGRTLTHEVGHCLNLLHTFQSGCGSSCSSSGDRVCDTPPAFEATYACNKSQNTCSNDASGSASVYNGDVVDQIENYMSYDNCQNMFTLGQKTRMKSALSSFSTLQNLVSSANLAATGTDHLNDVLCEANFEASKTVICAGSSISFEDLSFDGVTTHDWTFTGGFPQSSQQSAPVITYNTPGVYDVSLEVGNGTNNVQSTKSQYIVVLPAVGKQLPVEESFEFSNGLEANNWYADNLYQGVGWSMNTQNGATGNNSVRVLNYGYDKGVTSLTSPSYDLTNLKNAKFYFKRAFARRANTNVDRLTVFFSGDCGETWHVAWSKVGGQLATRGNTSSPYNTVNSNDWVVDSVNIVDSLMNETFKLKFEFSSSGGNNLYLDDINILGGFVSKPVLQYPANGQEGLPANLTLDWKATLEADEYELRMDTSLFFNSSELVHITNNYISTTSTNSDTEHDVIDLVPGATYYWRVRIKKNGANFSWSDTWSFKVDQSASTFENLTAVSSIIVFPNPTQSVSTIRLGLESAEDVKIEAIDITGKTNRSIYAGRLSSGSSDIEVNTAGWAKGIYLIRIFAGDDFLVRRFIVQ